MASTAMVNTMSMAESYSLTSLPTLFTAKSQHSFHSISSKSIKSSLTLSSSSFPSCVLPKIRVSPFKFVAHVVQTSDYAQQEEEQGEGAEIIDSGDEGDDGEDEGGEESFAEPSEDAKIFVGNLPFDVDSEGLARLFNQAGVVEIADVIYNRVTDQSRGFGFVTMSTVEEAEVAVEKFNRYEINGRILTVNKAGPRGAPQAERPPRTFTASNRIYVGNLPWQVDDARLEQVFSEHGKVVDARVVYDRETQRSRGFGFVTMSNETEVNDAVSALDGQSLDGRAIRVNVAEERPRRASF